MFGPPPREVGCRLAAYIEERRRELVTSVVRKPGAAQDVAEKLAFASAFLDRLCRELLDGDGAAVEQWADAEADPVAAAERARIVNDACAALSAGFVAEHGTSDDVVSYLALRAAQVDQRLRADRSATAREAEPERPLQRDAVVASLLAAMDARDRATCEHSRAVGMWCSRLAAALGCAAPERTFAALAGTLHDIGKIATPSEILLKPGPLDEAEWVEMRAHAQIGAKMLEQVPTLCDLAPIVRAHHERVDGSGYPDGLAGDAIPLAARIVAVADAFHAMISNRPYRGALSISGAIDELSAGAGSQWDAPIVTAMIAIVRPAKAEPGGRAVFGSR